MEPELQCSRTLVPRPLGQSFMEEPQSIQSTILPAAHLLSPPEVAGFWTRPAASRSCWKLAVSFSFFWLFDSPDRISRGFAVTFNPSSNLLRCWVLTEPLQIRHINHLMCALELTCLGSGIDQVSLQELCLPRRLISLWVLSLAALFNILLLNAFLTPPSRLLLRIISLSPLLLNNCDLE